MIGLSSKQCHLIKIALELYRDTFDDFDLDTLRKAGIIKSTDPVTAEREVSDMISDITRNWRAS